MKTVNFLIVLLVPFALSSCSATGNKVDRSDFYDSVLEIKEAQYRKAIWKESEKMIVNNETMYNTKFTCEYLFEDENWYFEGQIKQTSFLEPLLKNGAINQKSIASAFTSYYTFLDENIVYYISPFRIKATSYGIWSNLDLTMSFNSHGYLVSYKTVTSTAAGEETTRSISLSYK